MTVLRRSLLVASAGLAAPALAQGRPRVGEVAAATGQAMAQFGPAPARPLAPPDPVLMLDTLSTGPAARLACSLSGGIRLRLGENALLTIDEAVLGRPRGGLVLRAQGGPLLIEREPAPGEPPLSVTLPWARIGVRGTRFFAGPLEGINAVFVARGRVVVEAGLGSVTLDAGDGVDIPLGGGNPGPVRRWGDARIARAMAAVT